MRNSLSRIPSGRVSALIEGEIRSLDFAGFKGRWGILCWISQMRLVEALFLEQYRQTVERQGAVLLGIHSDVNPLLDPIISKARNLQTPLLSDPSRRVLRALGLLDVDQADRCQSFVFDPEGVIRYRLVHMLNGRGMSLVLEVLKYCQGQAPISSLQTSA